MPPSFDDVSGYVADNTNEKMLDIVEKFIDLNDVNEFESEKEEDGTPIKKIPQCSRTRKRGKVAKTLLSVEGKVNLMCGIILIKQII